MAANRSFKSLDGGDIPSLLHVKDLDDTAVLPPQIRINNNWFGPPTSSPNLSRSGFSASPDGFYLGWISRDGKSVKILDWWRRRRRSKQNRLLRRNDDQPDTANEAIPNYLDEEVSTIECNTLIRCISFGKLDERSKRECARPLNKNFHRVLNFPSETGGHIVATGYQRGDIDLWQVSTRTRILSLVDHKGAVRDVQFAPNGSLLLLSSSIDGFIKIWDCQDDGNLLKSLKPIPQVTWVPHGLSEN